MNKTTSPLKFVVLDLTKAHDREAALFWAAKKGGKTLQSMQERIAEIEWDGKTLEQAMEELTASVESQPANTCP
jgi:hypothetical protein